MSSPTDRKDSPDAPQRERRRGRCSSTRLHRAYDYARALGDELRALSAPTEEEPSRWTPHLADVQRLLETLERAPSSGGLHPGGPTPAQLRAFGHLLRDRRNAAGLSRSALALKAKLSDATLKFLETARHPPSRSTLIRLVGVEALGLSWDDVAGLVGAAEPPALSSAAPEDGTSAAERAQWFIADDFDWLRRVAERDRLLCGAGGFVPASLAYLDPHNAIEYLAYLNSCSLGAPRADLPLGALTQHIAEQLKEPRLQILALGCGDGTTETRLVQSLLAHLNRLRVELWFIDQSLPLLCVAHQRAVTLFGASPAVQLRFLAEDLHQLAQHAPLAEACERPSRLFLLMGDTLTDLEPESRFLRHGLVGAAPGDLLLLDVQRPLASLERPAEIERREWLLSRPLPTQLCEWLTAPFWRADRDVQSVHLDAELDAHGALPGSYTLQLVARVRSRNRPERRFVVYQTRTFEDGSLASFLNGCGWDLVAPLAYGHPSRHVAMLFRRRDAEDT